MSGDWIKMRRGLRSTPKVIAVARILSRDQRFLESFGFIGSVTSRDDFVTRHVTSITLASLHDVWSALNTTLASDGSAPYMELTDIDAIANCPGLGDAMETVGWVEVEDAGGLVFATFGEHNTTAKERGPAKSPAQRSREYRERKKAESLQDAITVTNVTSRHTEKRREEKSTLSPVGESEGASPARSHDQKKEIEEGESPQGHDPVTLESAKALAESCSVHDPVIVESWHANRSADGWKRPKGAPITAANWRDDLRAFGIAWKQRESAQAHHSPPGGVPSGEARESWQIEKDITRLKSVRQKIQNDHRNYDLHPTEPGQKVMKPEPKKKSADIREKLAELEAELINA